MKALQIKKLVKSTFRLWLSTFVFSPAALMFIGLIYFGNFNVIKASEIFISLNGKIVDIWFFLGWTVFAIKFVFLYIQHWNVENGRTTIGVA